MNKFNITLEKMPTEFSSRYFCKVGREYGITQYEIDRSIPMKFIQENCEKIGPRTYRKKLNINGEEKNPTHTEGHTLFEVMTEDAAISFLKSRGYKIMKQDWKEL